MSNQITIRKPAGNWLFGFREDGADRSADRTRSVDGDGLPFEEHKFYTIYQWAVGAPPEQIYNARTFEFKPNTRGNCGCSMPCTSLDAYVTSLGWYTRNMPVVGADDYTHHVVGKMINGVFMPVALPKELVSGGTGGAQLPMPPSGGIPAQTFTVGTPFSYTLQPWTGANEYEVKDLPAGLSFNLATRTISGTGTLSGNYNVTVVGIAPTGLRNSVTVTFTGQNAAVSRTLEELSQTPVGGGVKFTVKGEGGPEGLKIKFGANGTDFTNAPYADLVKVGNKTYEYTYPVAANGTDYTVRVEQKIGVFAGSIQVGFEFNSTAPSTKIYPAQQNLITGRLLWSSSAVGDDLDKINNLDLEDVFESLEEFQPIAGAFNVIENSIKARWDRLLIYTPEPETMAGAFVLVGDNISQSPGTFQTNINKPGVAFRPITGTESPLVVDLSGLRGDMIALQRNDTGVLIFNELVGYGDFPVENHPPLISTISDITRSEGQTFEYNFNPHVTDIDGDTVSKALTLANGFALPSWASFANGVLKVTSAPWEGGSLLTVFEYPLLLIATDEHGSSTSQEFKLRIQRVGTLDTLLGSWIHYDSNTHYLDVGANVLNTGDMRVNLKGADFVYGGEGFKVMTNGTVGDLSSVTHNKVSGFTQVLPGNYAIEFQEFAGGPVLSRALSLPSQNVPIREVYKKADTGTPTPSISSISQAMDSNGKPIISAVVLNAPNGVEIAIVQTAGSGWNNTSYGAATLVSGNSSYQRAYTSVPPSGSYRYDVRIVGTDIVQSNVFTVGTTAADYFLQIDWSNSGAGYLNIRGQVVAAQGMEYKFQTSQTWIAGFPNSVGPGMLPGAAEAYVQQDVFPTSTSARIMQFRKPGSDQVINVTIPAGQAPDDGQWHPIWTANLLVTEGKFDWDSNNKSGVVRFKPKNAGDQLQVAIEAVNGTILNGFNNLSADADFGNWQSKTGSDLNWYDLIPDVNGNYTLRRKFWTGPNGGTGVLGTPIKFYIRKKNSAGQIQTIAHTPSGNDAAQILVINAPVSGGDGGTVTPTPTTGTKVMMLGDSILASPELRIALKQSFDNATIPITYVGTLGAGTTSDPRHDAHPGFKIHEVTAGVASWINATNPDLILLMIGTNDVNDNFDMAGAPNRLAALIDTIYATKSNVKLIVGTIPPRTDATANGRVNTFNAAIPTVVNSRKANGRTIEYAGISSSLTTADLAVDGVHLNLTTGPSKMATAWRQSVQTLGTVTPPAPNLTRTRQFFAVKHAVSYSNNGIVDLKAELGTGFDEGLLGGVKLTLYYHVLQDPTSWANFKNVFNWVVNVKGKKFALHLNMAFDKYNAFPGAMNDSTAERYSNGGSTEASTYTPSFSCNEGYYQFRANGDTTNWNANNPKRILLDAYISAIQELLAIGPIWTLSQGRTHTGEGGYNSRVDTLADARMGGYEASQLALFKTWLYSIAPGNNIEGVRTLLGMPSLTDADLVPPTPNRGSWDAFWSTLKGTGLKQAWFEFRSRNVERDQKMFEYEMRAVAPGVPVGFEAGTFRGNQAVINGTTETLSISSTADFVKANLTFADDWALGGDVGRGLKEFHISDADGSLWDSVLQLWRTGYGVPGSLSNNDIAKMMIKYAEANGWVGVFGDASKFYAALRIVKATGIIGSDFVTIIPWKVLTYNSEEYRDPYSAKSLNNWERRFVDCRQVNSPWPLAA